MSDLAERFHEKYIPEPNTGCWLWEAFTDPDGYGQHGGRRAHRFSYELHRAGIPEGLVVMHSCDTPSCVNPDHLSLGTQRENQYDAMRKGRHQTAKLSDSEVAEIRAAAGPQSQIAKKYGINQSHVSRIKSGKRR